MKKTLFIVLAIIAHIVCYGQEQEPKLELTNTLKSSNSILNTNSIDVKNNEAPYVISDPEDGQVNGEVGSTIMFGAYYQPITMQTGYVVKHGDKQIKNNTDNRIKIEQIGSYIRVKILCAETTDSGRYTIKIVNEDGSCTACFNVTVTEAVPL